MSKIATDLGDSSITLNWAYIVTWASVCSSGVSVCGTNGNTFQLVLAHDQSAIGYLIYKDCFVGEVSVLLAQKEKQEESIYTVK